MDVVSLVNLRRRDASLLHGTLEITLAVNEEAIDPKAGLKSNLSLQQLHASNTSKALIEITGILTMALNDCIRML